MNIENFFKLKNKGTDVKTEIIAGITTFLTMSYIIVVNPAILSTKGTGMSFSGVLAATVLVSALSSILMGLIADLPYALAPGMGINAFFTYGIVLGMGVSWQTALGAVFISGIIFIILTLVKVREAIVNAIPASVRLGVAGGIGIFLTLIGLQDANFIVDSPATLIHMGKFSPQMVMFIIGLFFTMYLINKRVKGALMLGILFTSFIAYLNGRLFGSEILINLPKNFVSSPDFSSVFFKLDIKGALNIGMIGIIFTLLFTDMFDSISAFLGVSEVADLKDKDGKPKNLNKALFVDAVSTVISGLFGTSSGTTYIESASGIEEGGRSGLTAVVAGLLFLPFLYFSPILSAIPTFATAPALVIVGFYMMKPFSKLDFSNFEESMPAFLALILIPFTYSITQGISWSILSYVFLKIVNGKKMHPMLYVIAFFCILILYLS
jgi:AGZA family xanthine/uracil permease-like MFS transporter